MANGAEEIVFSRRTGQVSIEPFKREPDILDLATVACIRDLSRSSRLLLLVS